MSTSNAPEPPSQSRTPPEESRGGNSRSLVVIVALLVAVVLVLGGLLLFLVLDSDETAPTTTEASGEIFLEPVADTGPDPFTTSVAMLGLPKVPPGAVPDAGEGVESVSGATMGLYGGTLDQSSCDTAAMVEFLLSDPGKGAAWAEAQGIPVDEIEEFAAGLTPVQLTRDTRVTNHGYRDGRPTPRQSVLQAGTAVLVDRFGIPRVRCACGNPLLAPVRTAASYRGGEWVGWNPNGTVTVTQSIEVTEFVLVNLETGGRIVRPVGTSGGSDTDPATTTTSPPVVTTSPPTQAPGTTSPSSVCPPGYTEIGGACVDEFGNEPPGAGGGVVDPGGVCPPGYTEIGGACVDEFGNEPPGAG